MTSIESLRLWSGKDITEFPNYEKEEMELDVPYFINENPYRKNAKEWRKHNEQARIGAAVGTAKRKARQYERAERSKKECILFLVGAALMLLLVGAIG